MRSKQLLGKRTVVLVLASWAGLVAMPQAADFSVVGGCDGGSWSFNANTSVLSCNAGNGGGGGGGAGSLSFTSSTYTGTEGGSATPSVTRVGGSTGAVSVNVSLTTGTASANDFANPGVKTLSWADGEAGVKTYGSILFNDDQTVEGTESLTVSMSGETGGVSVSRRSATVSILDNDNNNIASCGKYRVFEKDYGTARYSSLRNRSMVAGDLFAMKFKTRSDTRFVRVSLVEFAGIASVRTMVISKKKCDLSITGNPAAIGIQTSLLVSNGFSMPGVFRLDPNTTYYVNFVNADVQTNPNKDTCPVGRSCGFHFILDQQ